MVAVLLLILIGISGIMKFVESSYEQPQNQPSWEEDAAQNQVFLKEELANPNIDNATKKQLEKELAITEYRLEKDLAPMDPTGREQSILDSHLMLSFVVLLPDRTPGSSMGWIEISISVTGGVLLLILIGISGIMKFVKGVM